MTGFDQLGWTPAHGAIAFLAVLAAFAVTFFLVPRQARWMRENGWVGRDVHKTALPEVPESGGLSPTVGMMAGMALLVAAVPALWRETVVLALTVLAAAAIGWVDDRKRLSSLKKIVLVTLAGGPIFLANWVEFVDVGSPLIPVLGFTRMTVIYPLVLPLVIAVSTNTVNMLEGYNGEGAGTCTLVGASMVVAGLILNSAEAVVYGLVLCAALLAFFWYNRYPARVFPGDVGTLATGAMIGGIGILGSIEVVMFCALLQHVFNSFYVLASLRGFRESHDVRVKDVWVDENDVIHASLDPAAPMTLPRLILAGGPLDEPGLVKHFLVLSGISGIFGVVAAVAMQVTTGVVNVPLIVAVLVTAVVAFAALVWRFPRVRGVATIMILLLGGGLVLLMLVDGFIVDLGSLLNFVVSGVLGLAGAAAWYLLQRRYFFHKIRQYEAVAGGG